MKTIKFLIPVALVILVLICASMTDYLQEQTVDRLEAAETVVEIPDNEITGEEIPSEESATENTLPEAVVEIPNNESTEEAVPTVEQPVIFDTSIFEVHFIDVGQADSALVLCDGEAMLIDGGNTADSSLIYSYLKSHGISHLNYIIATHTHEDHIGGLSGALNRATVDTVYCPVTYYDSETFRSFVKYVEKSNAKIEVPTVGTHFCLGSAGVDIIGCDPTADTNNSSIVLKITYGNTSFLFAADAERDAERIILNSGYNLKSTVLKVGHHGSANSTTYPFLREIMPEYAVISVGSSNEYGHPTEATLSRLRDAEVKVYRTDLQGHIICVSDGETVTFTVDKNPDADTLTPQWQEKAEEPVQATENESTAVLKTDYVGNKNTKAFHYAYCNSVKQMSEKNKYYYSGTREEMIAQGFKPCGNCKP